MLGELIAGRYELEAVVGVGGAATVFRARDRRLERRVALKLLHERFAGDSEAVERFRREARAAAQLSHPGIVEVLDRGTDGDREFIVFDYVEGENLKELVVRRGPLPVRRVLELGLQVARALAHAHEAGLVHRDVKPQNVLISLDGEARVTDFGIATRAQAGGGVAGTSHYLAPEQARGEAAGARADVYSLGAVLYELLAGEVPFPAENPMAVAVRHAGEPAPSIVERRPDVPLRLDSAIGRALAKSPRDRFPSMADLAAELEACLRELPGEADAERTMIVAAPVRPERRPRPARRRRPLAVPAAVAALAAIGAGFAAWALVPGGGRSTAPGATLRAVGAYDPSPGDGHEHDADAGKATDGDPATFWRTERYAAGLGKPGVGLVLDAGRSVLVAELTVASSTPGFQAEILAGPAPGGPFAVVSSIQKVGRSATFLLRETAPARYYVLWIAGLGGRTSVHVNEVSVRMQR